MNNEIGRKLTSLTLMTIMIAGGLTFAVPGAMPAAHAANANLFVSAENSQFDNYMSGPQVIEVVVIDSDINDTDQAKGEPDVTINGKILRMVQAVDGNWYGYFADKPTSITADGTSQIGGVGLDYGNFCTAAQAGNTIPVAAKASANFFSDTTGVWSNTNDINCVSTTAFNATNMNVLREAKDMNENVGGADTFGQIGIRDGAWPFIQLYTLNPTGNVVIQYNKGGGAQTVTLTFDTVDQFAGAELDKASYGRGDEVHATITDLWLNIDPTDEDSWTFGTTGLGGGPNASTNYQVFDENGLAVGDYPTNAGTANLLTGKLGALMCEDNCRLLTTADVQHKGAVITLSDNEDSAIIPGDHGTKTPLALGADGSTDQDNPFDWGTAGGNMNGTVPVTITEQGPNSGVFGSYDEGDNSAINITPGAGRGTSASIDYNDTPATVLVGFSFGSIDIQPVDEEWSSGEEIPVVLVDADANLNSRADEDLDFNNPAVALIPALKTGTPESFFEKGPNGVVNGTIFQGFGGGSLTLVDVQQFSQRAIVKANSGTVTNNETINMTRTNSMSDFFNAAPVNDPTFQGVALLNYDFRSLANDGNLDTLTSIDLDINGHTVATNADLQGLILIDNTINGQTSIFGGISPSTPMTLTVTLHLSAPSSIPSGTLLPMAADIFGFGFRDDGVEAAERVSNQLIRLELEETGDNTSTFEGTLEYTMLNQLNILDPATYTGLTPISDEATFIVMEDLTDEDAPRVNYLDLGADGVSTQVSDQEEAPSHSGIVSFDSDSYKIADTVTITLEDADLNVDTDLVDIFTVVSDSTDATYDQVGAADLPTDFSFGNLGRMLDVTFDDALWTTPAAGTCTATGDGSGDALEDLTGDTGLGATGFSLVETGPASGIFRGDFQIPPAWCNPNHATQFETTTGLDIEVNYVDFRDASGEIIEVGDSAGVRANTGSVSLDRTVYPVPFGVPGNFAVSATDTSPNNRSIFPVHATGVEPGLPKGSFLANGDLTIHVRVNDPDFDISASGEDVIAQNTAETGVGPVKISIIRGAESVILGFAGGPTANDGRINVGDSILGDGVLQTAELTFDDAIGFDPAQLVTITQGGASSATGNYTNQNIGAVQTSELTAFTNTVADFSDKISLTITDNVGTQTTATFDDKNDNMKVEQGEVVDIDQTIALANGPVMINGTLGHNWAANATFTDALNVIEQGEITITDGGSGFETGGCTITQGAITASALCTDLPDVREFGPITEIAPDAGIFEVDVDVKYTDGPSNALCPTTKDFDANTAAIETESSRFNVPSPSGENYCILQGDILQVEYTDPADASGDINTVTDSATFDLRNGVLQSDKSVYIIGSDMILTLIEPDFDLDNDSAETYDLDLIEWDSDAATVTMGDQSGTDVRDAFDPEPTAFRETGDSTGIFQIVIEIPAELQGDNLERGEEIVLEYTDWGPSGSDFVGDEDQDVNLTIYTSNFGATVELDQKVYTWTDKVYITIVAPDHNFDSDLVDEIGNTDKDPIKVSTRGSDIDNYKLVETGTDTGIFTGEVILTGFTHDADGDTTTGDANGNDVISRAPSGRGPTDGFLPADDDDGITVSFEFSEDETVVGSALIRWNIGEVQWLEASYPASGTGVVRIIDPDMNLDPEAVDNFDADIWSDSDAGGIDLTVTETNEATGIFEGTVFFTTTDESSGHRLRVAEGDTVTAEYQDNTLPDPYTTADELDITATSLIGTVVPPLERAPASNCRVVDAFGNTLSSVAVDQQVQITCDVANGQDREQPFAYLIQIQDANGVTVSLAWITGSLSPGQSFSPALSWIPENSGSFDVTAFVWESVDNPTALSPPNEISITVS